MWVPLKKNKKGMKSKMKEIKLTLQRERGDERVILIFFYISLFLIFTKIWPSEFIGINTKNALRDEGYA